MLHLIRRADDMLENVAFRHISTVGSGWSNFREILYKDAKSESTRYFQKSIWLIMLNYHILVKCHKILMTFCKLKQIKTITKIMGL